MAVFSISPGSIFTVDTYARSAIATSSVASGLGIACDAWFLLLYTWVDMHTFIVLPYTLCTLTSRFLLSTPSHRTAPATSTNPTSSLSLPCVIIPAISLMAFLAHVAFSAWSGGVLAVRFIVGVVMSLQFLVFDVHWCARQVLVGTRASGRGVVRVVRL